MSKDEIKQINKNPYQGREGLVYARVSSKRQEIEGSGLDSQGGRCIKELLNLGVPHSRTFEDSYSGGGDFMNRPAMREMIAYIDANPHKKFLIVFDDLKRFARDTIFHFQLRTTFKARDVALRCLNYNFDDSPEGVFTETIFAAQGQLEREQNKRQVIDKQKIRLELGYWAFASRKPYKMTNDPIHGRILMLQYPEADYLREALEGFANGKFIRKVDACKFLVDKGYWEKQSPEKYIDKFTELAKDVLFAGYIEYPKWGVERRKGYHEALISFSTYELNQKRLKNEGLCKRIRKDISEDFPIRGLAICFYCRHSLTAAWSRGRNKKYPYYFCQNKNCESYNHSIPKKEIESRFFDLLKRQGLKRGVGLIASEIFESIWSEEMSLIKKTESSNVAKKIKLEESIKNLTGLIVSTKSQVVRKAYEVQIESLADEILLLGRNSTKKLDMTIPYRTAVEKATEFLVNPYNAWQKMHVIEQHSLFYFIFNEKIPYDFKVGYRTKEIPSVTSLFGEFATANTLDVDIVCESWNQLHTWVFEASEAIMGRIELVKRPTTIDFSPN